MGSALLAVLFIAAVVGVGLFVRSAMGRGGPRKDPPLNRPGAPGQPQEPQQPFTPWVVPEPTTPEPATGASDWTPPPELAGLRAFERMSDNAELLDISPDGREALIRHDKTSVSLFDVATGKALQTWRNVCPDDWDYWNEEGNSYSCAARRLFLTRTNDEACEPEAVLVDLKEREVALVTDPEEGLTETYIGTSVMSADGRRVGSTMAGPKASLIFDLDKREMAWTGEHGRPDDVAQPAAISADGGWFAFDLSENEAFLMRSGEDIDYARIAAVSSDDEADEAGDDDRRLHSYGAFEDIFISGDGMTMALDFDTAGERLVIGEDTGGLIVFELPYRDYEMFYPFGDGEDDEDASDEGAPGDILGVTCLNDSGRAILKYRSPTPKFVHVDFVGRKLLGEWPATEDVLRKSTVSRTGGFALIDGGDGAIRVLPLLDDDA